MSAEREAARALALLQKRQVIKEGVKERREEVVSDEAAAKM